MALKPGDEKTQVTLSGTVGAVWGIMGVFLLIGGAVYRLTPISLAAFESELLWYHWIFLWTFLAFMLLMEGYRGFQRGFAPRVVARALHLQVRPHWTRITFAPLFLMGFFHATRQRKLTSLALTTSIVAMVILVSFLDQPWRGIVDLGVVAGLVWGLAAMGFFGLKALATGNLDYPADVPLESSDTSTP